MKFKNIFSILLLLLISGVSYSQVISTEKINKTQSEPFILEKDHQWHTIDKGVQRRILGYDGQLMMVKIKFDKDAVGKMHHHYHSQVTYVVSGKFKFTVGGETKIVKAGDALHMEPDIVHGCVCLEPGVLIDCFSPMRESFLPKN